MLINRNITVGRLRTSVRLEPEFWDALSDIAARERTSVDRLCTVIDANAGDLGRTAAIRVFIASYFADLRARLEAVATARPAAEVADYRPAVQPVRRAFG